MEEYFYHTDRLTRVTHLYVRDKDREREATKGNESDAAARRSSIPLDRSSRVFYTKRVFMPAIWEEMSQQRIAKYKMKYNTRFFVWSLLNKQTVQHHCDTDWEYLSNLFNNIAGSVSISGLCVLTLNRFLKRLDPPFFYDIYFNKTFQPKHLRATSLSLLMLYILYDRLTLVTHDSFLFDTGLKYKSILGKGELEDESSDSLLPPSTVLKGENTV